MDESLDALVRRVDEDRWLASRFAPPDVRTRLIALYALNHEIARTAEATVREPGLGIIRLAWWREALAEWRAGAPVRAHPVLQAYAQGWTELARPEDWDALIDARAADLDPAPFADWAAAEAYADATAGGLLRLAARACDQRLAESAALALTAAGRAWGLAGLVRAAPYWSARGRRVLPEGVSQAEAIERARAAHRAARVAMRGSPAALFPAMGCLALAPLHLDALASDGAVALLARQLKLVWAAATGRI